MRIEMLNKVLVGNSQFPSNIGDVVEADEHEAKALIAVGFAKETTREVKNAGAQPENKAHATPALPPTPPAKSKG